MINCGVICLSQKKGDLIILLAKDEGYLPWSQKDIRTAESTVALREGPPPPEEDSPATQLQEPSQRPVSTLLLPTRASDSAERDLKSRFAGILSLLLNDGPRCLLANQMSTLGSQAVNIQPQA